MSPPAGDERGAISSRHEEARHPYCSAPTPGRRASRASAALDGFDAAHLRRLVERRWAPTSESCATNRHIAGEIAGQTAGSRHSRCDKRGVEHVSALAQYRAQVAQHRRTVAAARHDSRGARAGASPHASGIARVSRRRRVGSCAGTAVAAFAPRQARSPCRGVRQEHHVGRLRPVAAFDEAPVTVSMSTVHHDVR